VSLAGDLTWHAGSPLNAVRPLSVAIPHNGGNPVLLVVLLPPTWSCQAPGFSATLKSLKIPLDKQPFVVHNALAIIRK
jgi:hypothetical protein